MFHNIESLVVTVSGSFVIGVLIGYALKKVIKLFAIVAGLFFAGVAYLQYQQIVAINWNKLQEASQNTLSTFASSTMQIPDFNNINHTAVLSNLGPLTGSISMGIAIGFMKG